MSTKPALQKVLKGILHIEEDIRCIRKMQERISLIHQAGQQKGNKGEVSIRKNTK
jgi:hypothetical protein